MSQKAVAHDENPREINKVVGSLLDDWRLV